MKTKNTPHTHHPHLHPHTRHYHVRYHPSPHGESGTPPPKRVVTTFNTATTKETKPPNPSTTTLSNRSRCRFFLSQRGVPNLDKFAHSNRPLYYQTERGVGSHKGGTKGVYTTTLSNRSRCRLFLSQRGVPNLDKSHPPSGKRGSRCGFLLRGV